MLTHATSALADNAVNCSIYTPGNQVSNVQDNPTPLEGTIPEEGAHGSFADHAKASLAAKRQELKCRIGRERTPFFDAYIKASDENARKMCDFAERIFLDESLAQMAIYSCLQQEMERQISEIEDLITQIDSL